MLKLVYLLNKFALKTIHCYEVVANLEDVLFRERGTDDSFCQQAVHGLKYQVGTDGVSSIPKQDTHVMHFPAGYMIND